MATPQPHGESAGRIQYRPHNADRSERGLLNILPRTLSLASPSEGKAKSGRVARLTGQTGFAPNTENFSAVHNISVVCLSRLARYPGVSGGGAALSSLCRRFPGGDITNLTSRRSPLSGLSFSLFFFLRERKRGYWRRRSRKISVGEAKCYICRHKRAAALHLIRRLRRHLPLGGEG